MVKRDAKEAENNVCCKADGEDDGYEDYKEELTYVIRRLMLALKTG